MNKSGWVSVAVAALLVIGTFAQTTKQPKRRILSASEAQQLVHVMLAADDWTKLAGFVLYESPSGPENGFYFVHAEHDNPGGGSAIGHYAVDQATADVWDWVICGRFTSPALWKEQHSLRKRMGLTDVEYRKLQRPGPGCEAAENPTVLKMGRPMWGVPKDARK